MRSTILIVVACVGLFVAAELARAGVVVGRDGKSCVGNVQLKADDRVAITTASGQTITLSFADVKNLSMLNEPPASSPVGEQDGLPAPWRHADIGRVKTAGSVSHSSELFIVRGAGWGFWGPSDSGHVLFQPLAGDGEIIARIVDVPNDENSFLAGVTIRGGLEPNAAQVSLMLHADGAPHLSFRPVDGREHRAPAVKAQRNTWLRLIRAHDTFGAFYSSDGQNWSPAGAVRVRMNDQAWAGLACAAIANQELDQAKFDHVTVRAEPMGPTEGLGLVDGSFIAGRAKRLDAKGLTYTDPDGAERSIPAEMVSCIFTRPLLPEMRRRPLSGAPRICMTNGDVMEAQIKGLADGRVSAVSVALGPQNLELNRVAMVIFRPMTISGRMLVSTRDGSIYRCTNVRVQEGGLTCEKAVLGNIAVQAADLRAIAREMADGK